MKKLISIIIPTHNKSSYLDVTLHSYMTFKIQHEIIIVDDGSQDSTKNIISKYKNFLNIRYIYQNNYGLSKARNTGAKYATGNYLLFMDDDRIILNDYLNVLQPSENIVLIGYRRELYIKDLINNINNIKDCIALFPDSLKNSSYYERYFRKVLPLYSLKNISIPWVGCTFSNTLISSKIFCEIGGFDENFNGWGFEDLELAYRIFKTYNTEPIYFKLSKQMINYHLFHGHSNNLFSERQNNFNYFCNKHNQPEVLMYEKFSNNTIDIVRYNDLFMDEVCKI